MKDPVLNLWKAGFFMLLLGFADWQWATAGGVVLLVAVLLTIAPAVAMHFYWDPRLEHLKKYGTREQIEEFSARYIAFLSKTKRRQA